MIIIREDDASGFSRHTFNVVQSFQFANAKHAAYFLMTIYSILIHHQTFILSIHDLSLQSSRI